MNWTPGRNLGQVAPYSFPGPALSSPHFQPPTPPAMSGPALGQLGTIGPAYSLLGIALGAGAAWTGYTVGTEKKGFQSVTGYVVGVLGAISAVGGTFALLSGK